MSEIRTHGKAKLTEWRIDYTGGGQLLELTPRREQQYQQATLTKIDMPPNPLLAG